MQRSKAPGEIGSAKWNEGESNTMNLADLIASLPEGERAGLLEMAQQYQDALVREKCQTNFLEFVKAMWPGFIHGRHHAVMAKKFEAIAEGQVKETDHQHASPAYEVRVCIVLVASLVFGKVPE
jgi:hypothetical protein